MYNKQIEDNKDNLIQKMKDNLEKSKRELNKFLETGNYKELYPEKYIPVVNTNKVGRNEPCTCGSGLKYKKCCGR